ncbi:AlpA family phage regulatory protein [Sinorhizobium medicae]|nr:AlpA family phage regulatory protein [Sinorhizobium medicae]
MAEIRFLRLPEVRARVGLSRSQIYRLIQDKSFPAPLKISAQVSVWPDGDITRWQTEVLAKAGRDPFVQADSTNG